MRDPRLPLKVLKAGATSLADAAGRVHFVVLYEGPQRVFVDETYRVYACPVGTLPTMRLERAHPKWLVGTYATWGKGRRLSGTLRRVILGDLRERLAELQGCAA